MTRNRRIAECLARGWAEYRIRKIGPSLDDVDLSCVFPANDSGRRLGLVLGNGWIRYGR